MQVRRCPRLTLSPHFDRARPASCEVVWEQTGCRKLGVLGAGIRIAAPMNLAYRQAISLASSTPIIHLRAGSDPMGWPPRRRSRHRSTENSRSQRHPLQGSRRRTGVPASRPIVRFVGEKRPRDFLALSQDAVPDIPVLKEAKVEHTKLQRATIENCEAFRS